MLTNILAANNIDVAMFQCNLQNINSNYFALNIYYFIKLVSSNNVVIKSDSLLTVCYVDNT